jgi:phosphate transport system substrate-binding protein
MDGPAVAWNHGAALDRLAGRRSRIAVALAQQWRSSQNCAGKARGRERRQPWRRRVLIRNQAGTLVTPDASSFQAAAATAAWEKAGDFNLLLTDTPGQNAYPIVATVFILMRSWD